MGCQDRRERAGLHGRQSSSGAKSRSYGKDKIAQRVRQGITLDGRLPKTKFKRRLIVSGVEMGPKESKCCCSIFATEV